MDYSRIEPFGQIVSAVADLYEAFNSGQLEEDKVGYLTGYLVYAFAMNVTNKSYMQGVIPLGQLLTPGWSGVEQLKTLPLEQPEQLPAYVWCPSCSCERDDSLHDGVQQQC